MLPNTYFLAKCRFDTVENEPAKNLQNFRKMHFSKMHFSTTGTPGRRGDPPAAQDARGGGRAGQQGLRRGGARRGVRDRRGLRWQERLIHQPK